MTEKWEVQIGASPAGAIGGLYWIKRTYELMLSDGVTRSEVQEAAIARAYQDGDIEHVRVERMARLASDTV